MIEDVIVVSLLAILGLLAWIGTVLTEIVETLAHEAEVIGSLPLAVPNHSVLPQPKEQHKEKKPRPASWGQIREELENPTETSNTETSN